MYGNIDVRLRVKSMVRSVDPCVTHFLYAFHLLGGNQTICEKQFKPQTRHSQTS